jgi:hypothetical protein
MPSTTAAVGSAAAVKGATAVGSAPATAVGSTTTATAVRPASTAVRSTPAAVLSQGCRCYRESHGTRQKQEPDPRAESKRPDHEQCLTISSEQKSGHPSCIFGVLQRLQFKALTRTSPKGLTAHWPLEGATCHPEKASRV